MNGVERILPTSSKDDRGYFKKMYSRGIDDKNPDLNFQEIFYSKTNKHCVRGFHLQVGIASNHRLIRVIEGSIKDYLLDLRPSSQTYGEVQEYELNEDSFSLLVPPGVAHAFFALQDSIVFYATTSVHNPEFDTGVRFDSVIDTTAMSISSISIRDQNLPTLQEFKAMNND